MRQVKTSLVAAGVACVMAFAAQAAQANQFIVKQGSTTAGEFALKGASGSQDPQVFEIGETVITCDAARAKGTLSAPNETFAAAIQFKDCTTEVVDGALSSDAKVSVTGPLPVSYSAEEEINADGPITFEIKALQCEIVLTPIAPGSATYTTESVSTSRLHRFPSGFQHKLAIASSLRFATSISEPCASLTSIGSTTGGAGAGRAIVSLYRGTIFYEVPGADLGFEEEGNLPGGWSVVKNQPGPGVPEV